MKVQFNTDKTIDGDARLENFFSDLISKKLDRYDSHITRVEVHVSDENGKKEAPNDIKCVLEARFEGKQPVVVSAQEDTIEKAVSEAIDKMKAALETVLGKLQNR
ncbi:Sigma 54 modulation protein / S30EA ribosomal protein [Bernardetia litoralis DSM 6794]|uniref:Sigma 54 modulation protein / S30EA ribosomal protein n=1 Tax=Bernardetia litoralis (strain ATCC 23117 / DSM 6794 / NBRC 15988 / NCIMB 1366 / Fx l1 / Sio-4) TaxID=880071 RepID=I4AKR6_BERLS|nr:HPF/RaiA family ribosome-associated protein [Bernardetia litoralis]AFM04551.1 Sigma 54 modulation protein / S30EA ribosomal protein [Bernardetia litoralis DSM 6794]